MIKILKNKFSIIIVLCICILQAVSSTETIEEQDKNINFHKKTIQTLSSSLGSIANDRGSKVKFPYPTPDQNKFNNAAETYLSGRKKQNNLQFEEEYSKAKSSALEVYEEYKNILDNKSFHNEFKNYRAYHDMIKAWNEVKKKSS